MGVTVGLLGALPRQLPRNSPAQGAGAVEIGIAAVVVVVGNDVLEDGGATLVAVTRTTS